MRIRWYGQAAFLLTGERRVFIDPFHVDEHPVPGKKRFDYPPIAGVEADVLLVTHGTSNHNAVEAVQGGSPHVVRSTAGTFETPIGEVVAVSSEHDPVAGTRKGRNTILRFEASTACGSATSRNSGRTRCAPSSGGRSARSTSCSCRSAAGRLPAATAEIVRIVKPRLAVAMRYRTTAVDSLDPPAAFLEAFGAPVERIDGSVAEVEPLLGTHEFPKVLLLDAPARD